MIAQPELILASASPRRRELLTQAGYTFMVVAAHIDETPLAGEAAAAYVERLAVEKAYAVSAKAGKAVVLAADTSVVLADGTILGKPADAADAERMLHLLSGCNHSVMTGLAVVSSAGVQSAVETTQVTFAAIPLHELTAYAASNDPLDKAGAYAIQGYAARWIPRIEGCYFNVVGLPIARMVQLLTPLLVG